MNVHYTFKHKGVVYSLNDKFKVTAQRKDDEYAVEFLFGWKPIGVKAKTIELLKTAISHLAHRIGKSETDELNMIGEGVRLAELV